MTPPRSAELLPAALARDTVEQFHAETGRPRPWVYLATLVLAVVSLGALPIVEVDVTVRAAGLVRAATEQIELRSAVAGRVARLLAGENAAVRAGQPVIELEPAALDERLAHNRARQRASRDLIHDLSLLATAVAGADVAAPPSPALTNPYFAGNPDPASLSPAAVTGAVAAEASASAAAGDSPPPPSWAWRTPAVAGEQREFATRLAALELAARRSRTELERVAQLHARGIAPARELDEARYTAERAGADISVLRQQSLTQWQTRLRTEQLALMALVSEEAHLGGERSFFTVRSPLAGTLLGLAGVGIGSWVTAGQVVATLSPDDRLVIEAAVPARQIGFIRPGQPVRIAVDTYPASEWGTLPGMTRSVSADVHPRSPAGSPHFQVTVNPQGRALVRPDGAVAPLRKGMSVQTRFHVARRSLLRLLSEDAATWIDPRRAN